MSYKAKSTEEGRQKMEKLAIMKQHITIWIMFALLLLAQNKRQQRAK